MKLLKELFFHSKIDIHGARSFIIKFYKLIINPVSILITRTHHLKNKTRQEVQVILEEIKAIPQHFELT